MMASSKTSETQRAAAPAAVWYSRDPLTKTLYDRVDMSRDKAHVTCQIAWEIDAIARALPGMAPVGGSEDAPFLVRAVADRLCKLSEILVAVLANSSEDVQCLALGAFLLDAASAEPLQEAAGSAA